MSGTQQECDSPELSNVPEVPESTNLVAMALNDSTPDLITPVETDILKDHNANANVAVDAGSVSQGKRLATEEFLGSQGAMDVLCDRLKGMHTRPVNVESPSSSFEDLSGMPGKIAKNYATTPRLVPTLRNPPDFSNENALVACSKCNRTYPPESLKAHEQTCNGNEIPK